MYQILIILLASAASAILYRLGGAAGYNTKFRDIGCSLISCMLIGYLIAWNWTLVLVFGLTWASLSTYWKRTADARWHNWLMVGVGISLATLPFTISEGNWIGFVIRTFVLGITTMLWSELNDNPVWEECGRGALIILTIPLMLI